MMAENDDRGILVPGRSVGRGERPAQNRFDPGHLKIPRRHPQPFDGLAALGRDHKIESPIVARYRRERPGLSLPRGPLFGGEPVRIRLTVGPGRGDEDHLLRMRIGRRGQKHSFHEAEKRDHNSDSQSQGQYDHRDQTRTPAQRPPGIPKIHQKELHHYNDTATR